MVVSQTAPSPQVIDAREQRVPLAVPHASRIGNPMPIALGLLAFQLFLFGVEWFNTTPATIGKSGAAAANEYALIVAGLAQLIAGLISFFRGEGYRGQIASMFGLWLCGFYLLARDKEAGPAPASWFLFALVIPLVVIMIPAVISRIWGFIIAFGSILPMAFFGGFGFRGLSLQLAAAKAGATPQLDTPVTLLHIAALFAWLCTAALAWLMTEEVLRDHGVLSHKEH